MKRIITLVTILAALAFGMSAQATSFTAGNLVVYRLAGDASGASSGSLTNGGNIVWLDEYSTNGVFQTSHMMPTNYFGANSPLIGHGTTFGSGLITRSVDGRFILVAGYGATLGQFGFSLQSTFNTEAPRVIGLVDGNGNIDTTTVQTNSLVSGEEVRSAASPEGTNLWFAGAVNGISYTTRGSALATQLSSFITNIRQIQIVSNTLYFSDASGTAIRIGTVGTQPPPTTNGSFMATLSGVPGNTNSPFGFTLFDLTGGPSGPNTLYFTDSTGFQVWKYSLVGTNWVSNGSIGIGASVGLTGRVRTDGTVDLWTTGGGSATTGADSLWYVSDSGGYNAAPVVGGNPFLPIATSAANVSFRGITFAPVGGETFPSGPGNISVGPILGLFSGGLTGCSFPVTQAYSVANLGTSTVSWSATGDVNWVTLSPASGSLSSGGSVTVAVSFNANANSLSAGTNTATITFTNTTSALGTTTRAVRLILNNQSISPSTDFTSLGQPAGPFNPTNKVYTLTNGASAISWTASKSANWFDLSATSGSLGGCAGAAITATINANANSLAAGFYSDVISFSNATAGTLIDTRNVTLIVGGSYYCDDFSTYTSGDLVGQKGWQQVSGDGGVPTITVVNGEVVIPRTDVAVNAQDAFKNIPLTSNVTLYAGVELAISNAPALNPSYFMALNVTTNGTTGSNFANYRVTAVSTNSGFTFAVRITGQTGDPFTYGTTTLTYGQKYRVIIEANAVGTNMNVYVDPTSGTLGANTPYMVHPVAGGTPPLSIGDLLISQFSNGGSALEVGLSISKMCVSTNFADVYNGITSAPSDPFSTWQSQYFGCTGCGQAAGGADPDGDGMINTNEFLAGFNPTNNAAYVHVISVVRTNTTDIKVTYLGASGNSTTVPPMASRTNVLEFTTGGPGGNYSNNFTSLQTTVLSGGTGLGAVSSFTDVGGATGATRYYRIRVLVP